MSVTGARGMLSSPGTFVRPPYPPPFTISELLIIEEALSKAWESVSVNIDLDRDGEVSVTQRLVVQLAELMNDENEPVPGFSADAFETPIRGNELQGYRREQLEKRPDIVFRRAGRGAGLPSKLYGGLFVECKLVGPKHTAVSYCKHGLTRFIDGRYAWAVSISMMVGYAYDGYSLPDKINAHFRRKGSQTYDRRTNQLEPVDQPSQAWRSVHERIVRGGSSMSALAASRRWPAWRSWR